MTITNENWTEGARDSETRAAEVAVPAAAAVPVTPRFCASCGGAWDAVSNTCSACGHSLVGGGERRGESSECEGDVASVKSAVALYFALLAVSFALMFAHWGAGGTGGVGWTIAADVMMSAIVVGWCVADRKRIGPLLARLGALRWHLTGFACGGFTYAVAHSAVSFVEKLGVPTYRYAEQFEAAGYGFWLPVVLIAVQPAVFEELAFRGSIQSSMQGVLRRREAVVVTALMFAILHLQFLALPHLIVMGLMLGWLRQASGSLYPGMVLHFVHNLIVLLDERLGGIMPW